MEKISNKIDKPLCVCYAFFMNTYTLITGATGGLGRAFCAESASRGENLWLTGRDARKLSDLKAELSLQYPRISIVCAACDLSDTSSRSALYTELASFRFSKLIYVAGVDIQKAFLDYTQKKILFQTRVNFEAAVSLTHEVLKLRAPQLEILAVSSVSAIYPMPYFALYSATKKALEQFFSALHVELKKDHVKVTTILPGAIPTREDIREQIKGQGLWGRLAAKSPAFVAKKSLIALQKNKRVYVPGLANQVMRFVTAFIPLGWKLRFIAARWSKITKDAF